MEFFDYTTIGKTDDEIMQMAIDYEEGNDCTVQLFWACEIYLLLAERGYNAAIVRLVSNCARNRWLLERYTISNSWFDIAKEELEKRIIQNDATACRILALCYVEGIGCEVNDESAIRLLKRAASLNDYRSLNVLGWLVSKGRMDDGKSEYNYYMEAAENGIAVGMFNLSVIENDKQKKITWLERAADLDYSSALFKLGTIYEEESDTKKAFKYYKKASELGYWKAYKKMAEAYRYGYGVDQNDNLAAYWYCMYYDIDDDFGYEFFDLYEYIKGHKDVIERSLIEKYFVIAYRGKGVMPKDYYLRLRNEYRIKMFHDNKHWVRNYKRIPSIVAITYLNTAFFGDFEEGKEDIFDEDALLWLEKGEILNDGATICLYCEAVDSGIGKIPNKGKVIIEKLNKAVELGFSKAMYMLGEKYWEGEYVEKDRKKALELITAATADYGPACLFMGNQYYYGSDMVRKDYDKALHYWSLPKCIRDSNGYKIKENAYDECVNNKTVIYNSVPVKMDKVKAHLLMEEASNSGESNTATFNLAWMYQNGEGNYPKDRDRALELYSSKLSDSEKQTTAAKRAIYNIAFIHFCRGDYDKAIDQFLKIDLSEQSYYQVAYLSCYFYYCGYYDKTGTLIRRNSSLFHIPIRELFNNRKEHPTYLNILFVKTMQLFIDHGRYGKKIYRNINMKGLKQILHTIGDIPLQLEPEKDNTGFNSTFVNRDVIITSKEEKLHLLENYFSNMTEIDDKALYYESILNWFMNNRDVINSPIMINYWKEKLSLQTSKDDSAHQKM